MLLGLGKDQIKWSKAAFEEIYGLVSAPKPTTYRTDGLSWVHVAHPSGSQTDPQYLRWCNGETKTAKVVWARNELARRRMQLGAYAACLISDSAGMPRPLCSFQTIAIVKGRL